VTEARTTTAVFRPDATVRRRVGYSVGIVVNTVLLYAINVWPSWRSLTFVTDDAEQLLPLLNASLTVGIIANAIYIVFDRKWVKALGDLITVGISLVLLVSIWQVFPFAFNNPSIDWATIVRVVLGVSIFGCVIALVVQLVVLIRELSRLSSSHSRQG
jgi:hypothetical protein